jgi:hypothetical protein
MRRREAMERQKQFTGKLLLVGLLLAGVLVGAGVATALEVGEEAPDFTLQSTLGKRSACANSGGSSWCSLNSMVAILCRPE